uniref:Threonylcarbamoyladenosine tRNA methylthiotransferase n=2 Tax=Mesocestoides corti TaxID=53468 RepID=A0A5K3FPD3_MESCO
MEKRVGSDENGLGGSGRKRRLGGAPLSLPKIRRNPLIEILVVSTGCLNACTYCKTKHARGVLASYTVAELVQRAIEAFNDGVREIWLTSEDLGAYGRDLPRFDYHLPTTPATVAEKWPNHLTLADLLFALVPTIPAGCMLRLGMTNPPYILDQLEEVAAVLRHPRVYAFVHIPVQSGSNSVLESMRRAYTVEEFQRVVECLTSGVHSVDGDKLTVATDLICGFPTETEADFQDTVKLVERYKFPVLFINQFFARPGTPAATMKRVATTAEVKKRTRRLHDLFRSYCPFDGRVGRVYRVLITEASTDSKHWVGHTKAYEQILLPKDPDLQGRIVLVEVTECDKFFMRGKVIDRGPFESLSVGEDDGFQLSLQTVGGPARVPEDICHKSTIPKVILSKTKSGFDSSSVILVAVVLLLAAWVIIKFFGSV